MQKAKQIKKTAASQTKKTLFCSKIHFHYQNETKHFMSKFHFDDSIETVSQV